MNQLTPAVLEQLLATDNGACISIYLPTYKTSPDSQQNPIRFRNLIKQAKEALINHPLTTHRLKETLSQIGSLHQDEEFWQHQNRGLAIFIKPDQSFLIKLPLRFQESVHISRYCNLKPLLPMLTTNGKFYLLTLSQKDVKLYVATRTDIDKVFLGDIPRSMEEVIYEEDLHQHLQFHSKTSNRGNGGNTINQGQRGPGDRNLKIEIEKFLRQVENGITSLLEGQRTPLILAGVEYLTSMYRKLDQYPYTLDETIDGSPEETTKEALHQSAWKIIRPRFKQAEKDALETYHSLAGTGKTADYLQEVVPAAYQGKVENLFVLRDRSCWGNFRLETVEVELHDKELADSEDLCSSAVIHTIKNGGTAYSLKEHEMPGNTPLAATFRY